MLDQKLQFQIMLIKTCQGGVESHFNLLVSYKASFKIHLEKLLSGGHNMKIETLLQVCYFCLNIYSPHVKAQEY